MDIKRLSAAAITDMLPQPGHNVLLIGGKEIMRQLQTLAAGLAITRPVYILDGGNRLEPFLLAGEIRRQGKDPNIYLDRIFTTRAFSSVQFQSMTHKAAAIMPRKNDTIYFVLDALNTFYDESLPLKETKRLLALSIQSLLSIGRRAPLVVQIKPLNQQTAAKPEVFDQLCRAFPNALIEYAQPNTSPIQLGLF